MRTSVGMHLLLRSSLLKSEPRAPAPIKAPRVVVIGPLASLSFSVFLYPPSFGYLLPNADRDPANLPRITSILPYRINYSRRVIPRAQLPMNIKQTNYIIAIDEIVLSTQSRITLTCVFATMIRILSRTKKGISNGVRVTFRNVRSNLLSSTHKREIRRPRCPIQFGSPPTKLSTLSFSVNKDIRASSQKQWCRSRNLRGPEMATVSPVCIAASEPSDKRSKNRYRVACRSLRNSGHSCLSF